ncbi:MAG: DUF4402 domain-containing protein [Candidatus Marinimicrobia bacterium]|nr:DUF4402 domain-containing protein [Candidatus Neomarinimicrobiota bacterium]
MKKITTIVLMTTLVASVFAGDNATATVDAVVQANLALTNTASVDFGTLQPTSTPIIDPKNASHTDVTAPTVGTFTLTGAAGQVVAVTEGGAVTLGDGTNTMTFTPDLEGHATTQGSATDVGATITLDGSGNFLFWLGGDLGTLTNQPAGAYASDNVTNGSGDWSLSVEYN